MLELLVERFTESGYNAVATDDGDTACRMAEESRPDVLIIEHDMPDVEGMEVCRRIRDMFHDKPPGIVVLSYVPFTAEMDEAGCKPDDWVVRPFSLGDLEARVVRVLNMCRARMECKGIFL